MLDNGKAEGARKIKQIEKYCLRDIAIVSQGFTFSRSYQGKKNLKWNYFKVADIGINPNSKYLTNAINTISDITMEEIGALPFPKGSIVFPRVGAALFNNNKKILAQDGVVDDNVLVLTVTDTSKCWHEFLYYYLQGIPLAKWCNSGLVPVINTKTVLNQMVFLPPLPEQQKIAAILSTQDKVIELKEKLLVQKQQQKKYLMQQLLTGKKRLPGFNEKWKVEKFSEIFDFLSTNTLSRDNLFEGVGAIQNIHYGDILTKFDEVIDLDCVCLPSIKESAIPNNCATVKSGDIIIADTAEDLTAGKAVEVQNIGDRVIYSGLHTMLCRPKEQLFSDGWLGFYMNSEAYHKQLIPYIAGVKVMAISKSNIVKTYIAIPSKAEQAAIVEILSTADHEIDLLHKSIEAEKQKKKALMQLLLTGKVRVKI